MIGLNEDALICDLAETYQIYDYKRLPVQLVAVFAVGLREDSRIKMEMLGLKARPEFILQAAIVDRLGQLTWLHTKDATKGANRPVSLLSSLVGYDKSHVSAFNSAEDFEKERKHILLAIGGNDGD